MKAWRSYMILLFWCKAVCAQEFPALKLIHVSEKEGLCNNHVSCIAADKKGFIWLGTQNGLSRFDGSHFRNFYHYTDDTSSIVLNDIGQIVPDGRDNLWLSTSEGISYFNTSPQKSINIKHDADDPKSLRDDRHPHLYLDKAGVCWVTTSEGLYRMNKDFKYDEINEGIKTALPGETSSPNYYKIIPDRKNNLWAYSGNRIFRLDAVSKKVIQTFTCPHDIRITNIFFDSHNRCWVCTWFKGYYEFVVAGNKWPRIDFDNAGVTGSSIAEWRVNSKNYVVFDASGAGIILFDEDSGKFHKYVDEVFDENTSAEKSLNCIYVDDRNILWIGSSQGLAYALPAESLFETIRVSNGENNDAVKNFPHGVFCFYDDPSGYWVSTYYGGGLYRFNKQWQSLKYLPAIYPAKKNDYSTGAIFDMRRYKNEIYASTDSGFVAFDTATYHSRMFYPSKNASRIEFRTIVPVSETEWWIRSYSNGIYVFDAAKQKFIKHYVHTDSCSNCIPQKLNWLLRTSNGELFVTGMNGLYWYQPASDDFIAYHANKKDSITFPANTMWGMAEDREGKLWIGTSNGICEFDPVTKKIEKIFPQNSEIGEISRVTTDKYDNIWFNSASGIWTWLRNYNRLIHFSSKEGLPENKNYAWVMATGKDGNIYNGTEDAIIKIFPDKVMKYANHFSTYITEVHAANALVVAENKSHEKQLSLDPWQNNISVDFSILNFDMPDNNEYFYRLLPSSAKWQESDNGHLAFYNLPPGNYKLEVKGGNQLSGTFSNTDYLTIDITPHWWQTLWFQLVCLFAIAGLITWLVRRRIQTIRKEASLKQKIAETEMMALRAQMNPHFIFNSLNSIENFMMQNEKRLASDYLNKFARLIRMILDSSRNELLPVEKDMEALQLYVDLEQLRFNKKFCYKAIVDDALLHGGYKVPSLIIQPYVENSIVHGFSHSSRKDLCLEVRATLKENFIEYIINDNGIGREQSEKYNEQNRPYHKSVGLQITKDRICIFNNEADSNKNINITDLYDEHGQPSGTRVVVKLKAI